MELGAYYQEIMEGTKDVREQIARAKFIPESEISRLDDLKEAIKSSLKQTLERGGEANA